MPLFGNKKKPGEPLRALTEKEIQSKLYGHLRPEGVVSEERDSPAVLKHLSGAEPKITIQGQPASAASPSSTPAHFSSSSPQSQNKRNSNGLNLSGNPSALPGSSGDEKVSSQQEKISRWVKQENAGLEKKMRTDALSREKEKSASGKMRFLPGGILSSILSAIVFLIRMGIQLLQMAGVGCIRLFLSLDFRKPSVRRAAYWITALGLLAGVFFGIHTLNMKREAAMKEPPRPAAKLDRPRKPKIYPPILPSLAGLPPIAEPQSPHQGAESGGLQNEPPVSKAKEDKDQGAAKQQEQKSAGLPVPLPLPANPPSSQASLAGELEEAGQKGIVIQVATFAIQEDSQKLASRLKQEHLRAFVRPLNRPGGRAYYCVFMGSFKTHREAQETLIEFRKREIAKSFKDAFIRSL